MSVADIAALGGLVVMILSILGFVLKGRAWAEERFMQKEPCAERHEHADQFRADMGRKVDRVHERLDVMQADVGEVKIMMARMESRSDVFAGLDKLINRLDTRAGGS